MIQSTIDHHCKTLREDIARGDYTSLSCLNWLKNYASDPNTRREWNWIGACLVMHGHLTVNRENDYAIK